MVELGAHHHLHVQSPLQKKAPTAYAGFFSGSLNLIKTIMGTGMLCLPAAFQAIGVIPAFLMLFLAAFLSAFGLYLLTRSVERVGGRDVEFATLSKATYPRLSPLFDLAIFLKCIGVAIGYLVVVGNLVPQLMASLTTNRLLLNPATWMTLTSFAIAPIIFMPKMDSLKYTSFLGMLSVVYMVGLASILFLVTPNPSGVWSNVKLYEPLGREYIKNFSVFVFSFTCHQNMLPIQNESKRNSSLAMSRVISVCVGMAFVMYMIFAVSSYAVFGGPGKVIDANLITVYPQVGFPYVLARFLYVFLVIFSFPLQTFPARTSALKLFAYFYPRFTDRRQNILYASITTSMLVSVWLMAITGLDLRIVLRVVGSTAGPTLCYLLPSLFWLKLEERRQWEGSKLGALCLLAFGFLTIFISSLALFF